MRANLPLSAAIATFVLAMTLFGAWYSLRMPRLAPGLTEATVIKILGRPSSRLSSPAQGLHPDCDVRSAAYALVFRRPVWRVLIVYFDERGRVICTDAAMSVIAR